MFAAISFGCKEEEREHARDRRRSPGPQSGGPAGDRRDPAHPFAGKGGDVQHRPVRSARRTGAGPVCGQFDIVLLDPPFRNGTLEKILPAVDKCTAPGGIVLCESETGIVLPAEAGGLTLKKQYKYGRVLLWKYTKPMQNTDPAENEPKGEAL